MVNTPLASVAVGAVPAASAVALTLVIFLASA